MGTKKILRFYYSADNLERAFENLIMRRACATDADADDVERLCTVIGEKIDIQRLWGYLDKVLSGLTEEERVLLEKYALGKPIGGERRRINGAVAKFLRRSWRMDDFSKEISVLEKYYCLLY